MNTDFFKGIKQWDIQLGDKKGVMPIFYYDSSSMTAIYTASTSKVRKLLPTSKMNPIEIFPGKCLTAFTAFEYRKTDIDSYNEFSIAFPITFNKRQIPILTASLQMIRRWITVYVWQLPVTTEIARKAGADFYGYPKFIADIEFQKENESITCHVSENGEKILSLKGNVLPAAKDNVSRVQTYSIIDDIPLVTNLFYNTIEGAQTNDKKAAALDIGSNHSICNTLRHINLSNSPIQYQYRPLNQVILYAGKNLMDD
jgi:hypothetical protein